MYMLITQRDLNMATLVPIDKTNDIINDIIQKIQRSHPRMNNSLLQAFRSVRIYGNPQIPLFVMAHVYDYLCPQNKGKKEKNRFKKKFIPNVEIVKRKAKIFQNMKDGSVRPVDKEVNMLTKNGFVRAMHICDTPIADVFRQYISELFIKIEQINLENVEPIIYSESPTNNKSGVYLVQPAILTETNRYKFGMSNKNVDNRIKSYGANTIVLHKYYCNNPRKIENILKLYFKNHIYANDEYIKYDNEEELVSNFKKLIHSCKVIRQYL